MSGLFENALYLRLGLALAIGFLIGLERGWKERDEPEGARTAGVRTFSLIGLTGGVFGALALRLDGLVLAAGSIVVGSALAVFFWRESERRGDLSATTMVAAFLTFSLGALATASDMASAAAACVAAAILLATKQPLHGWLSRLTWPELRAGLVLAAMTFLLLPVLPNRALDPWQALNPYELWVMIIILATISFVGYVAVKIAGVERGMVVTAAAGGLVASTAVTISLAQMAHRSSQLERLVAGCITLASSVMLLRVLLIVVVFDRQLAGLLWPVLIPSAVAGSLAAYVLVYLDKHLSNEGSGVKFENPIELGTVLRFGALLAGIMLAAAIIRSSHGNAGILGLAALSGLADVDAMTLSMANPAGGVSLGRAGGEAILILCGVNTAAKLVYAGYAGGAMLALRLAAGVMAILVTGAAAYFWAFV